MTAIPRDYKESPAEIYPSIQPKQSQLHFPHSPRNQKYAFSYKNRPATPYICRISRTRHTYQSQRMTPVLHPSTTTDLRHDLRKSSHRYQRWYAIICRLAFTNEAMILPHTPTRNCTAQQTGGAIHVFDLEVLAGTVPESIIMTGAAQLCQEIASERFSDSFVLFHPLFK